MATWRPVQSESVVVVDASVAASWVFDDESDMGAEAVLAKIREGYGSGYVPQHWQAEVSNAILVGQIRGRITSEQIVARLEFLAGLDLRTDTETDILAALVLAMRYDLTMYDAIYLELAIRRDLPLATLDDKLRRAASQAGVTALT